MVTMEPTKSLPDVEAQAYIRARAKVDDASGCWLWTRSTGSHGYGNAYWRKVATVAHRLSFRAFVGPIPENGVVRHTCDVRTCVNPEHLRAGTHEDNMRDMAARKSGDKQRPRGKGLTSAERHKMREMLASGATQAAIAQALGVNVKTVHMYANDAGRRDRRLRLDEQSVIRIVRMCDAGATHLEAAEAYGVSKAAVQKIMTGKNWASLTGIDTRR
jgi:hypothetical protein